MSNDGLGKAANMAQIVGVVVAVLAIGAGFLVPEVRQWLGLEERVIDTPASPTNTPSAGNTWTRPADGAVMVYVPAGEFLMGSTDDDPDADDDQKPQHTVYLDVGQSHLTVSPTVFPTNCHETGPSGAGISLRPRFIPISGDRLSKCDCPVTPSR